jgi:pimeloyl-ACP methyl ester carboxylesterase
MTHMEARADVTPPAPDAASAIEAVVHAGATETHYRRAGSGPVVLLLFPGGADDPPAACLFARLARRFRVIAPRPPASVRAAARFAEGDPAPVADWLRDLIDGLGLVRPGLVACHAFGPAALAFSRTDPDRAGALVALSRAASAADGAAMPIDEMVRALHAEMAVAPPDINPLDATCGAGVE